MYLGLKDQSGRAALGLLAGATMISFSAVFVKVAQVGPSAAGFYRLLFGGLVLAALTVRERHWFGPALFWTAAAAGVLFALDLFLWHRCIHAVGPGLATILSSFQVFFMAGAAVIWLKERPDPRFFLSIPLSILGLVLLVGLDWPRLEAGYQQGVILGLLTALTYACLLLFLRRLYGGWPGVSPMWIMAQVSLVSALLLGLETSFSGVSLAIPDPVSLAALVGYGLLSQVLGWVLISRSLPRVEASRAGLILLLQPTLAFVWDMLFFARPTGLKDLIGAGLALGAIYLGATVRKA